MKLIRFCCISLVFILVRFSYAQGYVDIFENGINTTYWSVVSDDTLYSYDDSNGDVRFIHKKGGSNTLRSIRLIFKAAVYGDFDVSIDFREAFIDRINGDPGNQVQLNLNFGGQAFSVVRSDEQGYGHNYHVWIDPPAQWRGAQSTSDLSGTLRVTRSGSRVSGFFNDDSIFSDSFNNSVLQHISLSLQNNGTTDSAAVTFDNFILIADSLEDIVSGLSNRKDTPASFKLLQNYPNPFNNSTVIGYQISEKGDVELNIYNLLGQKVASLVNKKMQPGSYRILFNAGSLPSGLYFYSIQAGTFKKVKKMMLVK